MTRNPNKTPTVSRYPGGMVGRAKTPAPLFGQRLSLLRKERGLTQVQFAIELGITDKLVEYYERRARNPSLEFVKKVSRFFGVSPSYFAADEVPQVRKPGPKSKLEKRVDEIKKLPPKQQELVFIMIDSFLAQAKTS